MPQIRLQKILSTAGVASRRAAEELITQGRVTVNSSTVLELGSKADPEADDIRVDGRRVKPPARRRYFLLNKPRGYITSRVDPQHRPTVIDLLARHGIRDYIYPVGRLDYESEGLLILTSDGDLAAMLTHPSHGVGREYEVRVLGVPDDHEMERLARGVVIDGRRTAPAEVQRIKLVGPDERSRGNAPHRSSFMKGAIGRFGRCSKRSAIPWFGCGVWRSDRSETRSCAQAISESCQPTRWRRSRGTQVPDPPGRPCQARQGRSLPVSASRPAPHSRSERGPTRRTRAPSVPRRRG